MKKALKVGAQIEKFKKRGMQFGDEEKAKEILLDVGYLYNVKLPVAVRIQPANVEQSNRSNIAGAIGVVKYMVEQISTNSAQELITRLNELLNKNRSQKTAQVIEGCTKLSQHFE